MNHDEFRDYLLGTSAAERRTALEEQMLCNPAVYEELLAIEEELIDEYLRGGLTKAEQQSFETHFLVTANRHKNLRFGKLLKRYMDSHPVLVTAPAAVRHAEPPAPAAKNFLPYLESFSRGHVLAASTLVVICLGVIILWLVVTRSDSRVVVVSLAPGSTKSTSSIQPVTVPARVDLKLELETNKNFPNYKSQLLRGSEPLQTNELKMEVKGDHNVVPLTITGEKLSPGEYSVRLCGVSDSGEKEFIDSYSFRVTTE